MVALIKTLLSSDHIYVFPGEKQSDRLEKEFGIYRQGSGGNYFITAEQVTNSLNLQRLKLFSKLDIQIEENIEDDCCKGDLMDSEEDIELIEKCFEEASNLTMTEKSTLYYISGYVAKKESFVCPDSDDVNIPESE